MSDNDFFTLDPNCLAEIFDITHKKLCKGEISLAEANRIGINMPEDWQFQFEEEDEEDE